jgi:hypothetical protein
MEDFAWLSLCPYGRKSFYVDGHKREDIVGYREQLSQRFEDYESRMTEYEGNNVPSKAVGA